MRRHLRNIRWTAIPALFLAALYACTLSGGTPTQPASTSNATIRPERVIYQVDEYYPPYTFKSNEYLYGFDPYLTNFIFQSEKYLLRYSTDTWDRVYARLVSGEIDLAGIIAITDERKNDVLFSKPLFNSHISVYTLKTVNDISLSDLDDLSVGVKKGYYPESILKDELGIQDYYAYDDVLDAVVDLLSGKIDAIFENQQYMDHVLIQNSLKGKIVAQITNLFPRAHAYAISKKRPELVEYMNGRIDALVSSGVFEEIYVKYFYGHSDGYTASENRKALVYALSAVAAIAGIIILLRSIIRSLERKLSASMAKLEYANAELAEANEALRAKYDEIRTLAYTNPVTGLPNKSEFRRVIQRYIDEGRPEGFTILYLDLDNFKDINDAYGHAVGDELLKVVSERLRQCPIPESSMYNLGSDEFAVLLCSVSPESAGEKADEMIRRIEEPLSVGGNTLHISASMGIVSYPEHGEDFDELLKNADSAMYRAKFNGSGTYTFFSAEIGSAVAERTKMQNNLRQALAKNEFQLYYQPQTSASGDTLYGFEALLRWNSADMGVVAPGAFIHEAEESRLIIPIGQWVLTAACEFIRRLNGVFGTRYFVSVNVSVIQLLQEDYVDAVLGTLRETGLKPELLELEITESCLLFEADLVIEKLRKLSEAGVGIALDDFGTGYSSLRYLRDLPANTLKIDRSFLNTIASEKGKSLLDAIISIGHSLGMSLVAEGVETTQQLASASGLSCDRIQGYLIARPMPEDDVAVFIKGSRAVSDGA